VVIGALATAFFASSGSFPLTVGDFHAARYDPCGLVGSGVCDGPAV
jgi:hypothetical protein